MLAGPEARGSSTASGGGEGKGLSSSALLSLGHLPGGLERISINKALHAWGCEKNESKLALFSVYADKNILKQNIVKYGTY